MRKYIVTVIVLMLMAVSAQSSLAGEKSHRKAAEKLLELSDMASTMDQVIDQTLMMEIQQTPQLVLYQDVMKRFFKKYLGWESLKDDFVKIYMEEFTEEEIRDIVAFYETPTGQKTLKKAPVLFAKGAEIGQRRVEENIAELQTMLEEETERLRKLQESESEKEATAEEEDDTESKKEAE
jgi:hypothetical protein